MERRRHWFPKNLLGTRRPLPLPAPTSWKGGKIPVQKEDILARIGRLFATFPGVEALRDVYGSIPGRKTRFCPERGRAVYNR
ncbi:MAG: hypothetical protein ACQXXC_00990 [Methanolinea tarda]|jgi:hypothetical protein